MKTRFIMKCEVLFLKDDAVYSFELLSIGREEKGIWDVSYEIWFSSPNVKIAKAGIRQDLQCSVDFFKAIYIIKDSALVQKRMLLRYTEICAI